MSKNIYKPATLIILVFMVMLLPKEIKAQQEPGFTQYMNNPLTYNPAYAGTKDGISGVLQSRYQWVGFDGAPQTHLFSVHSPSPIYEDMVGIGFSYINDQIGPLSHDNFFMNFSYRTLIHDGGMLSLGLSAGVESRGMKMSSLNPLDPGDPTYSIDDPSHTSLNFGFGAFYYTDEYYVGLSVPKLRNVVYNSDAGPAPHEQHERHIYLTGGYILEIDQEWTLRPSLMAKYVNGTPLSLDFNVTALWQEMVAGGISYRHGDAIGALVQVKAYDYIWVGYAYDIGISGLRDQNRGTHEILLSFDLNLSGGSISEPRFRFY